MQHAWLVQCPLLWAFYIQSLIQLLLCPSATDTNPNKATLCGCDFICHGIAPMYNMILFERAV